MTENKIQAFLIKKLLSLNIIAVKINASRPGWPDVLAIHPGGAVHFIEVKTEVGRLSPHQMRVHEQLQEQGANVITLRGKDEVYAYLSGLERKPAGGD